MCKINDEDKRKHLIKFISLNELNKNVTLVW